MGGLAYLFFARKTPVIMKPRPLERTSIMDQFNAANAQAMLDFLDEVSATDLTIEEYCSQYLRIPVLL
nr:MAG TPA: hypothetical protein [Caudoviricetes sp.]